MLSIPEILWRICDLFISGQSQHQLLPKADFPCGPRWLQGQSGLCASFYMLLAREHTAVLSCRMHPSLQVDRANVGLPFPTRTNGPITTCREMHVLIFCSGPGRWSQLLLENKALGGGLDEYILVFFSCFKRRKKVAVCVCVWRGVRHQGGECVQLYYTA